MEEETESLSCDVVLFVEPVRGVQFRIPYPADTYGGLRLAVQVFLDKKRFPY
jgi:hypothetical protein